MNDRTGKAVPVSQGFPLLVQVTEASLQALFSHYRFTLGIARLIWVALIGIAALFLLSRTSFVVRPEDVYNLHMAVLVLSLLIPTDMIFVVIRLIALKGKLTDAARLLGVDEYALRSAFRSYLSSVIRLHYGVRF